MKIYFSDGEYLNQELSKDPNTIQITRGSKRNVNFVYIWVGNECVGCGSLGTQDIKQDLIEYINNKIQYRQHKLPISKMFYV